MGGKEFCNRLLDVHQRYCEGYEIGSNGQRRRFRLANTREAWEEFGKTLDQDTRIVMEATSNAFWIYDILSAYPGQVVVANPLKTRAIAEARVKTDALDAQILAQLLAADFIPMTWVPAKNEYELRVLLHHRIRLAKIRTMLKNKIHAALTRNGLNPPCTDLFGKKGRLFLEEISLPRTDQIVMISCLKLLDHVQREIDELEGEIHDKAKDDPNVRLLMGIPGINVLSALTILAEIGDIKRQGGRVEVCLTAYLPHRTVLAQLTHTAPQGILHAMYADGNRMSMIFTYILGLGKGYFSRNLSNFSLSKLFLWLLRFNHLKSKHLAIW